MAKIKPFISSSLAFSKAGSRAVIVVLRGSRRWLEAGRATSPQNAGQHHWINRRSTAASGTSKS
jgi:hypothetical protein